MCRKSELPCLLNMSCFIPLLEFDSQRRPSWSMVRSFKSSDGLPVKINCPQHQSRYLQHSHPEPFMTGKGNIARTPAWISGVVGWWWLVMEWRR
jgi:hypothetical protein